MESSDGPGELAPAMEELVEEIRAVLAGDPGPAEAARSVADALSERAGRAELLTEVQRAASEDDYTQHVLHVEDDGSFSVVSLVWLEGQSTPIHDHVAWCVPAVHRGREEEIQYRLVEESADGPEAGDEPEAGDGYLVPTDRRTNEPGDVTALTPPGDIHRVRNPGPGRAISLHVYGDDISRLGSSIRRTYEQPVRHEPPPTPAR